MPTPQLRRYQFSLRSLSLFVVFFAVVCSIGVRTHWVVSAVIAGGGIAGGIVRNSWLGFVQGIVCGLIGSMVGLFCAALLLDIFTPPVYSSPPLHITAAMNLGAVIGSLIGGILGGLARFQLRR